ncbi:MAG: hydroxyethylthiazole kinase [Rhodovibrionaceae bacterium]
MIDVTPPAEVLLRIRDQAPLIHNITNLVAMDLAANTLLAVGASPAMAHAVGEVGEFVGIAAALTVNSGTFDDDWVESACIAADTAGKLGKPWVYDPVGAPATAYRRANAKRLMSLKPTILRGNGSEILAVAGEVEQGGKGVDSTVGADAAVEAATGLARQQRLTVVVTGATDFITDGVRHARLSNGSPLMARITAVGCALTALTGAAAAVEEDAFAAALAATAIMGVAGDMAAETAAAPGSFRVALLDALYAMTPEELERRAKIEA